MSPVRTGLSTCAKLRSSRRVGSVSWPHTSESIPTHLQPKRRARVRKHPRRNDSRRTCITSILSFFRASIKQWTQTARRTSMQYLQRRGPLLREVRQLEREMANSSTRWTSWFRSMPASTAKVLLQTISDTCQVQPRPAKSSITSTKKCFSVSWLRRETEAIKITKSMWWSTRANWRISQDWARIPEALQRTRPAPRRSPTQA